MPGPGSYEQDGKLIDSKIYSKKGLGGGFVSKTVRASAFGKASMTPAPGAYNINRRFTAPARPGDASTSAFKPPTLRSVTVANDPLPGPGQYNPRYDGGGRHSAETGEGFSSSAARRCSSTGCIPAALGGAGCNRMSTNLQPYVDQARFSRASLDLMPAPGQYNPALPGHSHAHSDDALPSAAFRSGGPDCAAHSTMQSTAQCTAHGIVHDTVHGTVHLHGATVHGASVQGRPLAT